MEGSSLKSIILTVVRFASYIFFLSPYIILACVVLHMFRPALSIPLAAILVLNALVISMEADKLSGKGKRRCKDRG